MSVMLEERIRFDSFGEIHDCVSMRNGVSWVIVVENGGKQTRKGVDWVEGAVRLASGTGSVALEGEQRGSRTGAGREADRDSSMYRRFLQLSVDADMSSQFPG
jgi:hypothetical protein